jgi:hypothetical protein
MYAVSLWVPPSFKLNIHNQCLNVNLVYPIYITGSNLECHRPPNCKVYAGDTTRSGFIINSRFRESYGALIYKLQKRRPHKSSEISKDTLNAVHLLVFWKFSKLNELYADILMVEHDKRFIWNENNLKNLCRKNFKPFKWHSGSTIEIWSLNDSVALMTTSEIVNEDLIVNITISEIEKYSSMRTPIPVDLKR